MDRALDLADDIAREFEGFSEFPYHDPVGFPTIGYGYLLSREKWADLSRWQADSERETEFCCKRIWPLLPHLWAA